MDNFKAGIYKQQLEYKSFLPSKINRDFNIGDKETVMLLEEASRGLGQIDAYSLLVPDIDLFIQMHIFKEATLSSKIEGTQTTLEDAVKPEEIILPEKHDDWAEVQNYTKAMDFAVKQLKELPVSMRLIKEIHKILLSGVRGAKKYPGEIRRSQNWIGGSNLKDAFFVPPHHDDLPELLSDMEHFWHNKNLKIPLLIKAAIFHYQFETLHPFCDGNGRMGRLIIPLMLVSEGVLSKPVLYISDFFERNKGAYYDCLTVARTSNDIGGWVKFFLSGMIKTANDARETLCKVVEYKAGIDKKILGIGSRAKTANILAGTMFSTPVIGINKAAEILGVSYNTAARLIQLLENENIIRQIDDKERNKYYELNGYLDLFKRQV
ncbi:MAG: Fic family protein [Elusimicrobiota bacterium]|jgi:Fic family protein|nr:Fic family protein [Elusimicrobiota bacterium]